jgi:dihydroorotase (multifunctional complex type)
VTADLGIENGLVISPRGRRRANLYVSGGRVSAVTHETMPARQTVDASDLMVMPGMIDAHVHFMDPSSVDREDFPAGSEAAARAGVTTVIEHSHSGPVRTPAELREKIDHLTNRSHVDFSLAAHCWPDAIEQIGPVWLAGAAFLKLFTCTTHGVPGLDPGHLHAALEQIAAYSAVALVHCEEESLAALAEKRLRAEGRVDGGVIPEWRNRESELAAVEMTLLMARLTGAKVVIAHASHGKVVSLAEAARAGGASVWVETCPQYLTLMESEVVEQGVFRKFTPPARARCAADLDAMWDALASGRIDYISTDHAPSTRDQKEAGSIWDVHFGLPGIDTTSSVLLDAAATGRIAYERVVEAYSELPARIYGLPRKGRLVPSADADLVLVDPAREWTVQDSDIVSKAGWSPFSGRRFRGGPVATFLRGMKIAEDGQVSSIPGTGRFLPGPGLEA